MNFQQPALIEEVVEVVVVTTVATSSILLLSLPRASNKPPCDDLCPSSMLRSLWEPSRSLLGLFSFCEDVESDAGSPALDSVPSSRTPVHQCEYKYIYIKKEVKF